MQNSQPRFDVRDYFRILQKRKWFIVLVGLAAMLIGGLYAVSYPKTYRASSLLLVKQKPSGVVWLTSPDGRSGSGEIAIETQAAIVMSSELAEKVALSLREKKSGERVVTDAAEVQGSLSAEPMPPDRIRVEAKSAVERNAIAFANEAAAQFIVLNADIRSKQDSDALNYLEKQAKSSEEALTKTIKDISEFQNKFGVYVDDAGASLIVSTITEYDRAKAALSAELAAVRAQQRVIEGLVSEQRSAGAKMQTVPNPTLLALRQQVATAQVALAELRSRYKDIHPAVQQMRDRVTALEQQITQTPSTVTVPYGSIGGNSEMLSNHRAALISREADVLARQESLAQSLAEVKQQSNTLPDKLATLKQLQAKLEMQTETHKRLLQELESKRLEKENKGSTAMVFDTAARAQATAPPVSRALLFAGVLGLVAGIALALLLEALDDTVHTPDDINRLADVTFLGMVPLLDTGIDELITIASPKSPPAESYRTLRSNVNFSLVGNPTRTFIVTSAGAGEGKSVTCANLAVVFAQAGQSVIVVDTDLRRPSLHRILHCESSRGLTNVLVGESTIEEVLQDTHVEGLRLLASGPLPPNPAEMLDSAAMQRLIEEIGNHADVIFFDTPPTLVLTDAVIMASRVPHTILVAEAGQVTREAFSEAIRLVNNAHGNILGVVLNKLRLSASDYYYYYYYYDYSRETPRVITPASRPDNP